MNTLSQSNDHARFLAVMPLIVSLARRRLAHLPHEAREELLAEAVAGGFAMYLSLRRRGRIERVSSAGFARHAVLHAICGRHVGGCQAGTDVMSELGRLRHGRSVTPLGVSPPADEPGNRAGWLDEAVQTRRMEIPDQVAVRLDGHRWLSSLSPRNRQMVSELATGEQARIVARRHGITAGRLSQLRREWLQGWQLTVGVAA